MTITTEQLDKSFEQPVVDLAVMVDRYIVKNSYQEKDLHLIIKFRALYKGLNGITRTDHVATFDYKFKGSIELKQIVEELTDKVTENLYKVKTDKYHVSRIVGIDFCSAKVEGVYE